MLRVYVAGVYSDDNVISVLNNIRRGIKLSSKLFLEGYAVFCPWLDFQFVLAMEANEVATLKVQQFYNYCIAWLAVSDVMYVISEGVDKSIGTQQEITYAKEKGIPIVYSLEELKQIEMRE